MLNGFMWLKIGGLVAGCCEHGIEASGYIEGGIFLDDLASINLSGRFLLRRINLEKKSEVIMCTHISLHMVKLVTTSRTGMKDYATIFPVCLILKSCISPSDLIGYLYCNVVFSDSHIGQLPWSSGKT
jgi:hypothetical protein